MRRLSLLLLALSGCGSVPDASPAPQPVAAQEDPPPVTSEPRPDAHASVAVESAPALKPVTYTAGQSLLGVPIEVTVLGQPRNPTILFLASIHGDEPAGTPLLKRLSTHLSEHPERLHGHCVVLIPVANPDGYAAGTRVNSRKVDLNRNFPSLNFSAAAEHGSTPLSEPETQTLFALLHTFDPIHVVTIHMQASRIDFDGPAEELARRMAAACDLEVERMGGRDGSLGSYVGECLNRPIITVELRPADRDRDEEELWRIYGEMLLAAID